MMFTHPNGFTYEYPTNQY